MLVRHMGILSAISFVIVVVIVALLMYVLFNSSFQGAGLFNNYTQGSKNLAYTVVTTQQFVARNQTVAYMLGLINKDRANYGLAPVSLSNMTSAQQHAESMLLNNYFSHWDIHGMKPYMRYTLLGGNGAVDENIAYMYNSSGINVLNALKQMEYNFMYNDLACCNNGHRKNILTPQHNLVSIGVAYNATSIYLVEDFINYYILWQPGSPGISPADQVNLKGTVENGYSLSEVLVAYEPPVSNLTASQLSAAPYNSSYSFPPTVAGIGYTVGREHYYYNGIETINATDYVLQGNDFDVQFNMSSLVGRYGPGEYTVMEALTNGTSSPNATFIGATYTFFINKSGMAFAPSSSSDPFLATMVGTASGPRPVGSPLLTGKLAIPIPILLPADPIRLR